MPDLFPPAWLDEARRRVQSHPPDLWPGFAPGRVPLLIFDGTVTHLSGAPPQEPGWRAVEGGWAWPGRHPALTANTAVTLPGGLIAAGVLAEDLDQLNSRRLAALLVHEAFHVFQQAHPSPAWETDELDALTYPRTNPAVAHTRAEEAAALAAALSAKKGWKRFARNALAWRTQRLSYLASEHVRLERRMETLEGLAHFVETRFLGEVPRLDGATDAGAGVREWAYRSGAALAHLLARGPDGWQAEVAGTVLDRLLRARLGASRLPLPDPELAEAAWLAVQEQAARLSILLNDFRERPGRRLTVQATVPLGVVGFDPLNLHALPDGSLLHTRSLRLSGAGVELEVMGAQARARGPGPLRVTELEVAGLPRGLVPTLTAGTWHLNSAVLNVEAPGKVVTQGGDGGWRLCF